MDYYDVAVTLSCFADSIEKSGAEVLEEMKGLFTEVQVENIRFELQTNGWL